MIVKIGLFIGCVFLTGCLGPIWTGASLIYDRHNVYHQVTDYQLSLEINQVLYKDKVFKQPGCAIEAAVFNGDILLTGHVPTLVLKQEAQKRITSIEGYRRIFNKISVGIFETTAMQDSWITMQIRTKIFADSEIDPHKFKVVTSELVVYLMGDVVPAQAQRVINIARNCIGVKRVVKLFKYYHLNDRDVE